MPRLFPADDLFDTLSPPQRLALAYAPRAARPVWLGYLALDARLAGVMRSAREPLVGQIRLAWWRDRLAEPASAWPAGEPLLAALRQWDGAHPRLGPMVDGWEVLLGEAPLSAEAFADAAEGRAAGVAAVADQLGQGAHSSEVARLAWEWALADFAAGVSDPREREALRRLLTDRRRASLPRSLRPLVVLHGLACRNGTGLGQVAAALRLGILGR